MLSSFQVNVYYYQEADGTCPVREFLREQPVRVRAQAEARVELLAVRGHQLHRPHCEYLGNDLYELRWRTGTVQYRILYFFHGRVAVILTHALTKEDKIPAADVARAVRRRQHFIQNPKLHTQA